MQSRRAEPKGEIRRLALLDALETLLRERELKDISVAQIATRAGLTRSAFYFYFASKESAVTDLLRDVWEQMVDGARSWIAGDEEPRVALGAAMEGTTRQWRRHRHLFLALLDARDVADVRTLYEDWVELFVEPLAGAVREARDRGVAPRDGTEPEALVRLLLGMNERALERHVRRDEGEEQASELADALARTWFAAIYAPVA